ncbi:HAMP domain-containing sensor histidine kinase, partial [uncultured Desulfovibrio sp.]|uniref:sensor histidine kinase n=1 Tax=uncultured Desulfovibrio sp. TaxID=167968 RepID=UPI00263B39A7
MARARLAQRMEHNKSLEAALRGYTTEVAPHVANIIATLESIARSADAESRAVRARMAWRLSLTTVLSLVIGAVLLAALVLSDRREQEKNRQISYRDGLFSLLAQNVDEVFIIARDARDFEYVSPNSGRLTGIDAEELREHPDLLRGFLPEADARRLDSLLAGADEDADAPEISFQRDGRVFSVSVYPAGPDGGHSGRRIILVSDRTRTARHEQELSDALESARVASAAKSSFLSHMSHEIRTPMNAIIGMTAIAMNRKDDPARVQDCLGKISESSRHLLGIINDVLDMSKIESGKLSVNHAPFNFPGVIRNLVDVVQPQATARGLNFDVVLQEVTEEELLGDSLRLTQVLINILGNSVKFTPAGGDVRVVIRQLCVRDGQVRFRFTISDTGIGMSE